MSVTDCKSLYDHLSAVGSPSTLHDKRSAIDVLIIRESMKKTGCAIRWAPTGLTKDKGESVECLRRSLRSGSHMLRGEEQLMQERHMTRVQKLPASEKNRKFEMIIGKPVLVASNVVLSSDRGKSLLFIFGLVPVLISAQCR